MEDLLLNIVKEATGSKLQNLKQAAQIAHDKLFRQHGTFRDASHELRSVCFIAFKMALDSKRANLTSMGLNGMHRLIRDERFFIGLEPEDDSNWLPAQLLRSTSGISVSGNTNEDTVVNVLRLFLSMACSPTCTLNGRLLIEVLSRCRDCWENGSRAVKAASLAAASQCLRTFCSFLKDEAAELVLTTPPGCSIMATATVYNEIIPVMQWLCSKLIEPNTGSPKRPHGSLFLMECILTLSTVLPSDVNSSTHFNAFLWKSFCPTLAAALGFPGRVNIDKKFTYKDAIHLIESENRGFFTRPGLEGPQARCIYLTAVQLLRIAGAQGSLRPMLEALFHRMLLLPAPANRSEPLRCVRDIFKSPERLIDLAVILYYDKNQASSCSDDMELFRLIIDAMEECATNANANMGEDNSMHSSVECIVALLSSLQTMCTGDVENIISNQVNDVINTRYLTLKEADYSGPLTYQSLIRLPRDYREAVAELKQNGFEVPSDSESEAEHQQTDLDRISNGSGETEGPEDENQSSGDEQSNWLYSHMDEARIDGETDRKHAKEFAKILASQLVPKLLSFRTSMEIDECIQEFSSNICHQNSMNVSDFDYNLTNINADGIYLTTYSAFLLALQLMRIGHYDKTDGQILIPLSEQQFVTSVQNAGVLVYLTSAWLRELYQSILATNPLAALENHNESTDRCTLIDMICDAGGIGNTQMLSEWQRLQCVTRLTNQVENEKRKASKKLARRLLTCCWDSMVTILSSGLGEIEDSKTARLVKLSKKHLRVSVATRRKHSGEAALYALSLEGLHAAATLSNCLNLQHLAGKILNLIATNVCQSSGPKLPASQALSMDVVLTGGLELGSYSADCWLPVFSVCRHVTQLEHDLFSSHSNSTNVSNVSGHNRTDDSPTNMQNSKNNAASCIIDEDETCVDVYSFLQAPLQSSNTSVATILKAYSSTVALSPADTAKVLCALSHLAENLFSDAAERLSLPSLCQFLKSLCRASREQLYRSTAAKKGKKTWYLGRPWKVKNNSLPLSLLLHRVGDVTLKVFRSSRPLLHILKIWAISGPHLMDAACHKDRNISKRAIEYIHDIITALLVEQTELQYFHFNEALLKPFENLLSMENCDSDVQDQIVACLFEVVEAYRTEIRSGWRPLFGTLRTAKKLNLSNVIDIFRVFLETENTLVFANAGLDCILCLLSYLEISAQDEDSNGINNSTSSNNKSTSSNGGSGEFLHDVLKFLERCATILGFLFNMPNSPNLHSTYKIKGISYTHIIDANIPNSMENFQYFGNDYLQNINEQIMISYRSLHIDKDTITKLEELEKSSGAVLKVWFLLLDGLTNSLILCPLSHQSPIIQTIFKLFRSLLENPGLDFGYYSINHLLIPMIQDWLRYINKTQKNWYSVEKNFKHTCCMTTDLVVEFVEKSQNQIITPNTKTTSSAKKQLFTKITRPVDNTRYAQIKKNLINGNADADKTPPNVGSPDPNDGFVEKDPSKLPTAANLALKQLLLVLIECSAQPQESVSRVGVSCLKHIIFSIGYLFNEEQWLTVCSCIHRAITINLAPLRQLSFAFFENSNSFYGDCATVKVAARKDCTLEEINRIYSLSQQVFLMDNQKDIANIKANNEIKIINEDRNYSFLLYSNTNPFNGNNENSFVLRIPYRNLVVGLLISQMLLQLIANILLGGLSCVPQELHSVIYDYYSTTTLTQSSSSQSISSDKKPQFSLTYRAKEILYRCLRQYLTCSLEFDYRPGLKFLIQKVSNLDYAANLYKQMTSAWVIQYMSLVDVYLNDIKMLSLSSDDLKYIIDSCSKVDNSIKKKEFFVRNLYTLREIWDVIADLYLKAVKLPVLIPTNLHTELYSEINIVENKMDEIEEQLEKEMNGGYETEDDEVFLPKEDEKNLSLQKSPSEESVSVTTIFLKDKDQQQNTNPFISPQQQRKNPFNLQEQQQTTTTQSQQQQVVSPEIEQQRKLSMMKDEQCKRTSLTQLIVASTELLRLLPNESAENVRLLLTTKINEAFLVVEQQENNITIYK